MSETSPLVKGGWTNRMLERAGLSRAWHIAGALALIMWVPLAVASAYQGLVTGNSAYLSFFRDLPAYMRYLIAVPLLVWAEELVNLRTGMVTRHIADSGLLREPDVPKFEAAVEWVKRMRDSIAPEAVLWILAFAVSLLFHPPATMAEQLPWRSTDAGLGQVTTPAGWWYLLVSLPIYNFMIYRWLWRGFVWAWFIRRVSSLDLKLIPTHPDKAGGLGFLSIAQVSFWGIILAGGAVIAAVLGQAVMAGATTTSVVTRSAIAYAVVAPGLILSPLLVFVPTLLELKHNGVLNYSTLANEYMSEFDRKWVQHSAQQEPLLGTSDIQSLADLNNSFEIVQKMRLVPFEAKSVAILFTAAALPMLPLLLTQFSVIEILKKLIGILF